MKTLILLLITLSLFAQTSSIDEQIAQLQNTDPQSRYKLMNEIKIRISSMNAAERSIAISKLQKGRKNSKALHTNQQHHSASQIQQINQQQRNQNRSGQHQQRPHQGANGNGKH